MMFWMITLTWIAVGVSTVVLGERTLIISYGKRAVKGVAFLAFFDRKLKEKNVDFLRIIYFSLELMIFVNFITIFLYPEGMYVSGAYSQNYFIGNRNAHIRWELPALCIKMAYDRLKKNNNRLSLNFYILYAVSAISAIRVESATSIILLAVFAIFVVLEQSQFFHYLVKKINVPPIASLMVLVAGTIIVVGGTIASNQIFALKYILQFFNKSSTLTGRANIWISALASINRRLFLGYGYETSDMISMNLVGTTGWGSSAHNLLLELLYTGGIVLVVIVVFVYVLIQRNFRIGSFTKTSKVVGVWLLLISIMGLVEPQYEEYLRIAWLVSFYLPLFEQRLLIEHSKEME